jgi:outer membrane immunogenic protein
MILLECALMKKMIFSAATVAASLAAFAASPAAAADLPSRAYTKGPVAESLYSWTGSYIGATAGYSWNRLVVNDLDYWDGLGDSSQSNHGAAVGGTVGYNWQNRHLVYGIEGDVSYLSNRSTSNNDLNRGGGPTRGLPYAQINSKIDALGTVRGRIGIAVDPALLYFTGGVAFGRVDNSYVDRANLGTSCSGCTTWSDRDWRIGWVAGGGVESALFGNWTAKVEGLYYQLSPHTVTIVPFAGAGASPSRQRFEDSGLIARVGLNYKFGDGAIVAKY